MAGERDVRLTVEIDWWAPPDAARAEGDIAKIGRSGLSLEVTEGRVVEAVSWPGQAGDGAGSGPSRRGDEPPPFVPSPATTPAICRARPQSITV